MKFHIILLLSLFLVLVQSSSSKKNNYFTYNFHCEDSNDVKDSCSVVDKKLLNATSSLTDVLDTISISKFEVFVDNVSKYRIDVNKDAYAIALDTNFVPINPKNNNIVYPYPNAKNLLKKYKLNSEDIKNNDFILLINNFKNNTDYLKNLYYKKTNYIFIEIFEGLSNLDKLPYPYVKKKDDTSILNDSRQMALTQLTMRKDPNIINGIAAENEEIYSKFKESYKLNEVIHWNNTLISKGKDHFSKDKYKYKRIIAVGDIHGDYSKFVKVLRHAKLIDKNKKWIGTDAILVQVGDLTDRGSELKKILDLLMDLRSQAKKKGGLIYLLIGNHEVFDLQAGYFVVSTSDFDAFGGYLEREKALSIEGKYGKLLRKEMNITMVVDENLFVHAGLNYDFAKKGIDKLNKHLHEVLSTAPSFDELLDDYYSKDKTHPLYTDSLFDTNSGPLWNRFFIKGSEKEVCKELDKVLKVTKAKRMIVGHTVQDYGKINTRCDNKFIAIDIGLSNCIGNYFGYLEILNNKKEIWARYS